MADGRVLPSSDPVPAALVPPTPPTTRRLREVERVARTRPSVRPGYPVRLPPTGSGRGTRRDANETRELRIDVEALKNRKFGPKRKFVFISGEYRL